MANITKTARLGDLGLTARDGRDPTITGLSVDSRLTKAGHLFAALPGTRVHGAEFIEFALGMGAGAILTDRLGAEIAAEHLAASEAALIVAEDPRQTLAYASSLWFADQPEVVAAVTGTNGKTSVASFLRQIWELLGHEAANIGTTGVEGAVSIPVQHTTPEPITLHSILAELAGHGVDHAVMEASSHGLAQKRLDGVRLQAAGFTNLTQDHLDYHADFEEYFDAKAGLFARVLPADGVAVVNIDDPHGPRLVQIAKSRGQDVIQVGQSQGADLRILAQRCDPVGQDIRFDWQGHVDAARLNLIGGFQADNVMMAAAMAIACGTAPIEAFKVLSRLSQVRGRMELVARRENGAPVFVDYAHTPDAVAKALQSLRPHVLGRLVVVFGAGGDRDPGKRHLMGQEAAAHADVLFVTDDNPRTEDPAAIRAMVLNGCPEATEVADRAEAILRGVDALGAGDALLIAGKGHETGQVIGDDIYPFDDREQASVAVAALDGHLA